MFNFFAAHRIAAASLVLLAALQPGTAEAKRDGERIAGSGNVVEVERPVSGFSAVRVNGAFRVELKASQRERVTVRADDNLIEMVETRLVSGPLNALEIGIKDDVSFRTRRAPVVTVEFVSLSELTVRGSGDVRADRINSEQLAVSIAGSGDVRIEALDVNALAVVTVGSGDFRASGRAPQQGYRIAGAGDVQTLDLVGQIVKVGIAGSGDAAVHASEALEVDIAGSGDVVYQGAPRITQRIAGSGRVRRAK